MKRQNQEVHRGSLRCAIYTRKSNEEGLEQDFNSLHAQRESCEAYIRSQAGEGWRLIPTQYDDGGFSGGNMERPALSKLLADVEAGKLDTIVVYKVDRLTRSLMDFAKIVEKLDARSVSFVSITQAFNTTTSMGRLTLNVLLSFAQFEREVTAERIRDKIAASKAKGMWMGGNVPLGYDLKDRKLIPNPAEAEHVRLIFKRYLDLRSAPQLAAELEHKGIRSKSWVSRQGRSIGGVPFRPGALCYILQNHLYVGEIVHDVQAFAGNHEPLIERELFDAVQDAFASNGHARHARPTRAAQSPLIGIIHDENGHRMAPNFAYGRRKKVYRYYASAEGRALSRAAPRVSATELEAAVLDRLTRLRRAERPLDWSTALGMLDRVEIARHGFSLSLSDAPSSTHALRHMRDLMQPDEVVFQDGRLWIHCAHEWLTKPARCQDGKFAERGSVDALIPPLAKLVRSAHERLASHRISPVEPHEHGSGTAPTEKRDRRIMALGLLAPDVQNAILEGRIRSDVTTKLLLSAELPLAWSDQRALFGSELG